MMGDCRCVVRRGRWSAGRDEPRQERLDLPALGGGREGAELLVDTVACAVEPMARFGLFPGQVMTTARGPQGSSPMPARRARRMASARSGTSSLVNSDDTWLRTVLSERNSSRAMRRLS